MAKNKDWFAPDSHDSDGDDDDDDDDDDVVTREMLHRDLLNMEPKVMRKQKRGKNGGSSNTKSNDTTKYKPLDNRDSLPFSVRNISPDPYTHPEIKDSRRQTSPQIVGKKKKSSDLQHHQTSLARLYLNNSPQNGSDENDDGDNDGGGNVSGSKGKKGSNKKKNKGNNNNNNNKRTTTSTKTAKIDPSTLLGEFHLDKSTTSGYVSSTSFQGEISLACFCCR